MKAMKNIQNNKKHKAESELNPYNSYFLPQQSNAGRK